MINISSEPYRDKLEYIYYNMVLQKNIDYLNTHGKGPYEYNGTIRLVFHGPNELSFFMLRYS